MKKRNQTVTSLVIVAAAASLLAACGLKSASDSFGLDGIGDPQLPPGNIVPGAFGGTFEVTRFVTKDPRVSLQLGADLSLVQGLFSPSKVEGLAGLPLLVINTTVPPRTANTCYYDLGIQPELGGNLGFVDVGPTISYNFGNLSQNVVRPADGDVTNPVTDQLIYITDFNSPAVNLTYGADNTMTWTGGTLAPKGFSVAPLRDSNNGGDEVVVKFPLELQGPGVTTLPPNPLVNGTDMFAYGGSGIPEASDYTVQWQPVNNVANDLGVEIVVQIYGPADLTDTTQPNPTASVNDLPYFNKLGQMVCLADESKGSSGYQIKQSDLDYLYTLVQGGSLYAKSTEDRNHNGVLDPGEDGNHNGQIDKVYGSVIILNRRAENTFQACLRPQGCANGGTSPVYISGNATKYTHLHWLTP